MGNSKAKKALKALKQRIETIEMNADMIERAVGRETTEETIKCKDEIKTLVEAYESQIELNKKQNIKIKNQRAILKTLQQKNQPTTKENIMEKLKDFIEFLSTKKGYKANIETRVFNEERDTGMFRTCKCIGSKITIILKEGQQANVRKDKFGTIFSEEDEVGNITYYGECE